MRALKPHFPTAELLAADLAGAQVDPNEAQKVLAYVRGKGRSEALFEYLQAIVKDGRAVIRSGRTLGYYRDLLTACQRHLRPLRGDYEAFLSTYAWSLQLLRYYRVVPQASQAAAADLASEPVEPSKAAEKKAAEPQLPAVGEIFTGRVLDVDENAVAVEVPGFGVEKALGVIRAERLEGRKYRVGNTARVEVVAQRTLKDGRIILELKVAPPAKRESGFDCRFLIADWVCSNAEGAHLTLRSVVTLDGTGLNTVTTGLAARK
ncbi:hypothetical protein HC891_06270 [Candidatus Gracilibacteria bacterium]|nr:hypothetical protein [Candidatus Gracilibacteria bacterium]